MPLYEYYCQSCDGVFEALRPIREASLPVPCPQCNRDGQRLMPTSFMAFTFRDGYPRRLPDKGTYWHLGKEVKTLPKRMVGYKHPELHKPEPKPRPTKGQRREQEEKERLRILDLRYRDKWGVDEKGFRLPKTKGRTKERKTLGPPP